MQTTVIFLKISPNGHQSQFLSKENKYIRFKINDLLAQTNVQMILAKIWKLCLELQYASSKIKQKFDVFNCIKYNLGKNFRLTLLFVDFANVYEDIIPLIKRGYGSYYKTDYYITK